MLAGDCSIFQVKPASGLPGSDLTATFVVSISACCDACNANLWCTSFSYFLGVCFLKGGQTANWAASDATFPGGFSPDYSSGFSTALALSLPTTGMSWSYMYACGHANQVFCRADLLKLSFLLIYYYSRIKI